MSNKITFFCQGELNRIIDLNKEKKPFITCEVQSTSPFGYMFLNQDELDDMNVDEIKYPEKTDKIQKTTEKELLLIKPDNDSIINIETSEREGFDPLSDGIFSFAKPFIMTALKWLFIIIGIIFILIFFVVKLFTSGGKKGSTNQVEYFNRGAFSPIGNHHKYM